MLNRDNGSSSSSSGEGSGSGGGGGGGGGGGRGGGATGGVPIASVISITQSGQHACDSDMRKLSPSDYPLAALDPQLTWYGWSGPTDQRNGVKLQERYANQPVLVLQRGRRAEPFVYFGRIVGMVRLKQEDESSSPYTYAISIDTSPEDGSFNGVPPGTELRRAGENDEAELGRRGPGYSHWTKGALYELGLQRPNETCGQAIFLDLQQAQPAQAQPAEPAQPSSSAKRPLDDVVTLDSRRTQARTTDDKETKGDVPNDNAATIPFVQAIPAEHQAAELVRLKSQLETARHLDTSPSPNSTALPSSRLP